MRQLTLADALIVASQMREEDRKCVRAVMGDVSDEIFAVNRWSTEGPAWVLDQDGPVAMFGLSSSSPWMYTAWLVASPRCARQSWKKLIRFARIVRGNVPAHRVEALVLSGWVEAARFAHSMGFVHEGTRRKAGRDGQDIEVWGYVK